jgi:hypothetical protein
MAVSNITLTKAMIEYAKRHKLVVPPVSVRVNRWGKGKKTLAWRVSGHLHEHKFHVGQSQWRTQELTHHFFPATMSEKIAAKARQAVAEKWSEHTVTSWYGWSDQWCAMTWSYIKAQAGSTTPKEASVPVVLSMAAHKQGGYSLTSSPRPGDGVIYDWEGDRVSDHIETLLSKKGYFITTAAGNSGPSYVVKRYRTTSNVMAWIRVNR